MNVYINVYFFLVFNITKLRIFCSGQLWCSVIMPEKPWIPCTACRNITLVSKAENAPKVPHVYGIEDDGVFASTKWVASKIILSMCINFISGGVISLQLIARNHGKATMSKALVFIHLSGRNGVC